MNLDLVTDDEGKFANVDDALRYAFAWDARATIRIAQIQLIASTTNPQTITHLDNVTQSAMILSSMKKLTHQQKNVLILNHSHRKERKNLAAVVVGSEVSAILGLRKWFTVDVCRQWAGVKMKKEYQDWAKNLNKDPKTLYNWAKGNKDRSISGITTELYKKANDLFAEILRDKGLIS